MIVFQLETLVASRMDAANLSFITSVCMDLKETLASLYGNNFKNIIPENQLLKFPGIGRR
jgi:hypothetical protein